MKQSENKSYIQQENDIEKLREHAIASSLAGFSFLLVFSITWFLGGILTYFVSSETAPWTVVYLGGPASLIAILLERHIGYVRNIPQNILTPLTLQILFTQIVAFPAIFLVYEGLPAYTHTAIAAVVGGHFLPFQWVYKTKLYGILGIIVSIGSLIIAIVFGLESIHYTGFFVGFVLFIGAFFAKNHAKKTWDQMNI